MCAVSGDLGVASTTPTTVSHAQTASAPTTTTAAHIGMSLVCTCTCTLTMDIVYALSRFLGIDGP